MPYQNDQLTPEETAILKELAKDMNAWGRVGRKFRTGLIWLSSVIAAYLIVWEGLIKHIIWRG